MKIKILGIETSCDETAAAVYDNDSGILSNNLFSQISLHKEYGGVVPEIASRSHMEKIIPIINLALNEAKVTLEDISAIAVTYKPGLPGSLLIGLSYAKALAWSKNKKLIGVNHLEAHIFSACIENQIPFPFLCITASGGHTSLYLVKDYGEYSVLGETLDDAAGEAFDKISKLINLGYPGGPIIEQLATQADFQDFFKYPRATANSLNFSFSGLKTAVMYDLVKRNAYNLQEKKFLENHNTELQKQIASSLLVCITDIFEQKLNLAIKLHPKIKAVAFVGGVACNKYIKARLQKWALIHNIDFFNPSHQFCTDNGAMVAFVGAYKARKNQYSNFDLDIY